MTREEFIELEFGDRVYWDPIGGENRVVNGHVAGTKFLNEKKAICMAFNWEDWGTGGMPRYVSERDMEFIAGLRKSQVVTSKKVEDFPNVWTGYVSKEEANNLKSDMDLLERRIDSLYSLTDRIVKLENDGNFLAILVFVFAVPSVLAWIGLILLAIYGFVDFVKTVLTYF